MPQDRLQRVLLDRSRISPKEQEVRDILNTSDIDPTSGIAPTAPQFRKQPEVWSTDPKFIASMDRTMRVSPELAGSISRVEQGPSADVMENILSDKNGDRLMDIWDRLNLVGLFNPTSKKTWVSPNRDPDEQKATLAHEAGHAKGLLNHKDPLFQQLVKSAEDAYLPMMNYASYKDLKGKK